MKGSTNIEKTGQFLIDANFYLSLIVLLYGCFTAISERLAVFEFNEELYGALHSNLRIALLYLAVTEIAIVAFSFVMRRTKFIFFAGCYLLMMLVSLPVYGKLNGVPIDNNLILFFLYAGISHCLFGLLSGWASPESSDLS